MDKQKAYIKEVTWLAIVGFAVNILLSLVKLLGALFGGSYSLGADAAHSLSDSITDLALVIGVRIWAKPADSDHPYGHQRVESVVSIFIGLFLAAAGVGIAYTGLASLASPRTVVPTKVALIAAAASIFSKEILFHWTKHKGEKLGSSAVIANAWHHRTDALSSVPVLLTLIVTARWPSLVYLDGVTAALVSLFILHAAYKIVAPSFGHILDKGACPTELETIRTLSCTIDGVKDIHNIRTRFLGNYLVVDLHCLVQGDLSVTQGHDIAKALKQKLLKEGPNIKDVLVHIEPYEESHQDTTRL